MSKLRLKKASIRDFDEFYQHRSEKRSISWSGKKKLPPYKELKAWFQSRLNDDIRTVYIIRLDNTYIGYMYLDVNEDGTCDSTIAISEKHTGHNYGATALKELTTMNPECSLNAWIAEDNNASIKIHERAGFRRTEQFKGVYYEGFSETKRMYKYVAKDRVNTSY